MGFELPVCWTDWLSCWCLTLWSGLHDEFGGLCLLVSLLGCCFLVCALLPRWVCYYLISLLGLDWIAFTCWLLVILVLRVCDFVRDCCLHLFAVCCFGWFSFVALFNVALVTTLPLLGFVGCGSLGFGVLLFGA